MSDIKIIYEDDDITILNKPAGVIVNRSDTHNQYTVQDFVEDKNDVDDAGLSTDDESEFTSRSGIVHRLDKDTSGVLLIAKNEIAFGKLQKQFKNRKVKKEYICVSFGKAQEGQFEVDAAMGRNPKNRLLMAVVLDGKPAHTLFETLKIHTFDNYSLSTIKANPLTGRTHQIRVHLAALNLQIVGDPIYDSKSQKEQAVFITNRMLLHALRIEFTHPSTNELVTFEAPLPQEFDKYI